MLEDYSALRLGYGLKFVLQNTILSCLGSTNNDAHWFNLQETYFAYNIEAPCASPCRPRKHLKIHDACAPYEHADHDGDVFSGHAVRHTGNPATAAALQDRPPTVPLQQRLLSRRPVTLRCDPVQLRAGCGAGNAEGRPTRVPPHASFSFVIRLARGLRASMCVTARFCVVRSGWDKRLTETLARW